MKNLQKSFSRAFIQGTLTGVFMVLTACTSVAWSQCEAGEVALELTLGTDAWGYEMYWEIAPAGAGCGSLEFIASGGNSVDVGCDGAGNMGSGGTTYGSNAQFVEGPFCVVDGTALELIHVDSYGDGGTTFDLYMDGTLSGAFGGSGAGNVWSFVAGESLFAPHDVPCDAAEIVLDGETVMVSNAGLTVQSGEVSPPAAPSGSCNLPGAWCGSDGNVSASAWLTYTPIVSDPVTVMACSDSTTFDTQLAMYRVEDCDDFTTYELVGSNDDACAGYASILYSSCLEVGATYLIQMDGWAGQQGVAEITLFTSETYEGSADAQQRNVTCPLSKDFDPNGFLLAYVNNGGSDFDCTWTGPDGVETNEAWILNLSPGTYTAEILTACGNAFTLERNIIAPSSWSMSSEVTQASCETSADGAVEVEVSGANGGYTFAWTGPGGFTSEEEDLQGVVAGTYQLVVTDLNGCTNPLTAYVTDAGYGDFTIGNDTIICEDEPLLLYGPTGLTYEWQDGSSNQFYYIEAGTYAPGTYSIILNATTDSGCEFADALILTVHTCSVGVDEVGLEASMVYPQPANEHVYLDIDLTDQPWAISVRDAAGREVHRGMWSGGSAPLFNVSSWTEGWYQIQLLDGDRSLVRPLMVRH
jgi:hypothetical protein